MCGIAGQLLREPCPFHPDALEAALRPIRRRGPDDEGGLLALRGRGAAVALAGPRTPPAIARRHGLLPASGAGRSFDLLLCHARYSIQDLSPAGHQPMQSSDGSLWIVYNGEIYNYPELRQELEARGVRFRSTGDTEVLLEGFRLWRDALWARLNGFFAAAIYDTADASVTLARDRLGVAPLYWGQSEQGFAFGSSIRSVLLATGAPAEPDPERVAEYLRSGRKDTDEHTFFPAVRAFPPAHQARFEGGEMHFAAAGAQRYWSLPQARLRPGDLSLPEAVQRYRDTFFDAVALRLRADVRVAFELSGGLDSSSIVAAAAELRGPELTSFTVRVPGELDEEPIARSLLTRYPIDFRVLEEPESDLLDELPGFARLLEEPWQAPNLYAQFKMRQQMKRQGVSVVLCGAGGDETLAGYSVFLEAALEALRRSGSRLAALRQGWAWRVAALGLPRAALRGLRELFRSGARPAGDFDDQVRSHLERWPLPYYLASNDHATMGIPLEHRLPFLDYRLVELALELPVSYLFRRGFSKYILRRAMQPFLPDEILWRPRKQGFPFALGSFLEKAEPRLSAWTRGLPELGLDPGEIDTAGLLASDPRRLWRICCTGVWLDEVVGAWNPAWRAAGPRSSLGPSIC